MMKLLDFAGAAGVSKLAMLVAFPHFLFDARADVAAGAPAIVLKGHLGVCLSVLLGCRRRGRLLIQGLIQQRRPRLGVVAGLAMAQLTHVNR